MDRKLFSDNEWKLKLIKLFKLADIDQFQGHLDSSVIFEEINQVLVEETSLQPLPVAFDYEDMFSKLNSDLKKFRRNNHVYNQRGRGGRYSRRGGRQYRGSWNQHWNQNNNSNAYGDKYSTEISTENSKIQEVGEKENHKIEQNDPETTVFSTPSPCPEDSKLPDFENSKTSDLKETESKNLVAKEASPTNQSKKDGDVTNISDLPIRPPTVTETTENCVEQLENANTEKPNRDLSKEEEKINPVKVVGKFKPVVLENEMEHDLVFESDKAQNCVDNIEGAQADEAEPEGEKTDELEAPKNQHATPTSEPDTK